MKVGEKFITNEGYEVEIVEYFGTKNITIKFEDGLTLNNLSYDNIKRGKIKNPFCKKVYNIGYLGVGEYKSRIKTKKTFAYSRWENMLKRCYSEEFHNNFPTYENCSVVSEWHNFQNFAKWFEENYKSEYMDGWHLDKDILFKGNKIYSPETCCFIPEEINNLFVKCDAKRGKYPVGVTFNNILKKYQANYSKNKTRLYVSVSNTPEEAFQEYKKVKGLYIKEVAEKYKNQITQECYESMLNYKIMIND